MGKDLWPWGVFDFQGLEDSLKVTEWIAKALAEISICLDRIGGRLLSGHGPFIGES